jgi:hypothetical protein
MTRHTPCCNPLQSLQTVLRVLAKAGSLARRPSPRAAMRKTLAACGSDLFFFVREYRDRVSTTWRHVEKLCKGDGVYHCGSEQCERWCGC